MHPPAHFFPSILVLTTLALTSPAIHPQASPRAVLQHLYQATGGDHWQHFDECDSIATITYLDKTGTLHYRENLRTGANRADIDLPTLNIKQADGNDPIQTWHQDAAGDIQLSPSSDPANVDDRYITSRAYWQPNFGGASITLLAPRTEGSITRDGLQFNVPGGKGFTLWINRSTGLLDRLEGSDTKQFSDYRPVSGGVFPFSERKPAGTSELVITYTTRTLRPHLDPTDFAVPFRTDYHLPPSGEVTVPAKNGLGLQATINGQGPFSALFDTGSVNILSESFAHRLGLKIDTQGLNFGTSSPDSIQAHTARIDTLQIGDLVLHNQTFYVLPLPEDNGAPSLAIGYELMRRLAVKVDYKHQSITFYDAPHFHYSGPGKPVPIQFEANWLLAQTTIGKATGLFILDTGNENGTFTMSAFANKNNLVQDLGAQLRGYNGRGFAGPSPEAYLVRVDTLRLGDVAIPSTIVHISTDPSDARTEGGNIGQDILRRFTEIFDCMHSQVIFETTEDSTQPEVFNRAGLLFDSFGKGLQIMTVLPGSPAAQADLRPGDIVAEINGQTPPDVANPPAFLLPPGTSLNLTIHRTTQILTATVVLKDVL